MEKDEVSREVWSQGCRTVGLSLPFSFLSSFHARHILPSSLKEKSQATTMVTAKICVTKVRCQDSFSPALVLRGRTLDGNTAVGV